MWIEYDHVVAPLVQSGDHVDAGQPLAQAAPASLRHGGPSGALPDAEEGGGLRVPTSTRGAPCPVLWLSESEQSALSAVLAEMAATGFAAGEGLCLAAWEADLPLP